MKPFFYIILISIYFLVPRNPPVKAILIGLTQKALAQGEFQENAYYFDFLPNTYLIPKSGIVEISIKYKGVGIKPENFKVKPQMGNKPMSLFNPGKKEWVFSSESWGNMPSVGDTFKIKIPNTNGQMDLHFKIKDLSTGKEYKTPEKSFWGNNSYKSYETKVNKTILDWRQNTSRDVTNDEEGSEKTEIAGLNEKETQTQEISELKNKMDVAIWHLGGFGISAIIGFIKKDDKMAL